MKRVLIIFSAVMFLMSASVAGAEDINQIFKKVNELVEAGNYSKALEELTWARKEIEGMHLKKLGALLPDTLSGYKGQPVKTEGAMGFTSVERVYTKGSERVKVSIAGASSGGAASGLSGFAAMGRMAAMMGGQGSGQNSFRIKGRTALLENQGSSSELTIFLDSGSMLKFEPSGKIEDSTLRAMGEAIDLDAIDGYLKGTK